jgi:hypothetical protein
MASVDQPPAEPDPQGGPDGSDDDEPPIKRPRKVLTALSRAKKSQSYKESLSSSTILVIVGEGTIDQVAYGRYDHGIEGHFGDIYHSIVNEHV